MEQQQKTGKNGKILRHLMTPLDFSVEELNKLFDLAEDIKNNPDKYAEVCKRKKLATCFYEPSTRTRLSFETAMLNLGGQVIGFSDAKSSSASKGESVSDTIRVISCFADICAMRHPKEGAPMVAAERSRIPVINAGDGGHQQPNIVGVGDLVFFLRRFIVLFDAFCDAVFGLEGIGVNVDASGTHLQFNLPFDLSEEGAKPVSKKKMQPPAAGDFTGKRILLAEDSEMSKDAIKAVLEVVGFTVDTVENGRKAVIQFVSQPAFTYDAVLMDVHMPFMDGREATKCIRISGKEDGEVIPIIGLMSDTTDKDAVESKQAGMQAHLGKPVDVQKLYKVMHKLIPLD